MYITDIVVVPKRVTTLHCCTLVKVDDRVIPLGPITCICPYSWSESISVELTFSHILSTWDESCCPSLAFGVPPILEVLMYALLSQLAQNVRITCFLLAVVSRCHVKPDSCGTNSLLNWRKKISADFGYRDIGQRSSIYYTCYYTAWEYGCMCKIPWQTFILT